MNHNGKNGRIYEAMRCFLAGVAVGVGAILPGVSGGVLCVAFGFYELMMELLTHPIRALRRNLRLYIPFGLGGAVGFLLLAGAIEALFVACPAVAMMLFFGLICGALPDLFHSAEVGREKGSWTPFLVSLSVAFVMLQILETEHAMTVTPGFLGFLFCGVLWGVSVVVPGFTSSAILISLGLFEPFTAGVASFDLVVLLPFGLGMAVTVLLLARLAQMLFQKKYALMMRIVLGFVIASALKIVPTDFGGIGTTLLSLLCCALGFLLARATDLLDRKKNS